LENSLAAGLNFGKLKHIPPSFFYELLHNYNGVLNIVVAPGEADVHIARTLVGNEGTLLLI
jgi:hypothetical protein